MKLARKKALTIGLFLLLFRFHAQVAGVFAIPNDFPTIAAAINTLNAMGVAGHVTINISAGHTETATAGGLRLLNVAGTSFTSQIVFRKNGSGANPLVIAHTGTATPTSSVQDGIWMLAGTDFVTIDGIDLLDSNAGGNAMMEFGYRLYKVNAADWCQYNTIKNCVITLNRNNVISPPLSFVPGGVKRY